MLGKNSTVMSRRNMVQGGGPTGEMKGRKKCIWIEKNARERI